MRSRVWPDGKNNDSMWIAGCQNRGRPQWQRKSKQWKAIIEGSNSGKVDMFSPKCAKDSWGEPSGPSCETTHKTTGHVPFQTESPSGCLKISFLNASHGLVSASTCASLATTIPEMTDPDKLAFLLDEQKHINTRLRLGKHRRYNPSMSREEQLITGRHYIFFDKVHSDAIHVLDNGQIHFYPTMKSDGCHVLTSHRDGI